MASLAKMRVTPTKPLGYGAAEFALVLDEVHSMCLAVLNTSAHTNCCTLSTHQLLFLEVLVVVLCCLAVFHSAKVRLITFETLIIR